MKLAVCIPHANPYVISSWYRRVALEVEYPPHTILLETTSLPIETARNRLVSRAYNAGADAILFIDDDIWPPINGVQKLLAANLPIVGGLCRKRKLQKDFVIFPQELQNGSGLVQVEETGCGFLLIKKEVFEAIAGSLDISQCEFFKWAGSVLNPCSEDIFFCRMAKKHGYSIWIDRDVKCGHHDTIIYDDSECGFTQLRRGTKDEFGVEKMEEGYLNGGNKSKL